MREIVYLSQITNNNDPSAEMRRIYLANTTYFELFRHLRSVVSKYNNFKIYNSLVRSVLTYIEIVDITQNHENLLGSSKRKTEIFTEASNKTGNSADVANMNFTENITIQI